MSDEPIVLSVASYKARATAERDMRALGALTQKGRADEVAAAVVEKGPNGWLEIARDHDMATPLGLALLGSAITVVAAPLGITLLASLLATSAQWAGAAKIVGRFWHEVPRDQLRTMANLLEAGPAGLVVVTVGHRPQQLNLLLSNATTRIVTDCVRVDLEADFATTIEKAAPASPPTSPTMDDVWRETPLL